MSVSKVTNCMWNVLLHNPGSLGTNTGRSRGHDGKGGRISSSEGEKGGQQKMALFELRFLLREGNEEDGEVVGIPPIEGEIVKRTDIGRGEPGTRSAGRARTKP